jgi:hypothetical protein
MFIFITWKYKIRSLTVNALFVNASYEQSEHQEDDTVLSQMCAVICFVM